MKVGFVSLGCSKNLIDTEVTIGKFKEHKFQIVNNPKEAEIIVINTCGFIESAKEEAINTILEMAEYKKKKCKYLIVMGCLVQRYYDDLKKALPEVDLFMKIEEYDIMWDKIEELMRKWKRGRFSFPKSWERESSPFPKVPDVSRKRVFTKSSFNWRKLCISKNW